MAYSSIVEIVGIKELVEDNYRRFIDMTQLFKASAESVLAETINKTSDARIQLYMFRDHCFIESSTLHSLLYLIKKLRIDFFETAHYFFRCVVTYGELDIKQKNPIILTKKKNKYELRYMEFSEVSTRLFAIMERFKGIGILLDEEKLNKADKDWIEEKKHCFLNFYVADTINKKFQPFLDVSITKDDLTEKTIENVFLRMSSDRIYSRKLARFYIPLLLNIAKHIDFSESENSSNDFEFLINKSIVTKNREVTGFEFFYFMLIDRVFSEDFSSSNISTKVISLIEQLSKNSWLLDLLRNDSKFIEIPKEILSNSKRRIALRKISELIQTNERK